MDRSNEKSQGVEQNAPSKEPAMTTANLDSLPPDGDATPKLELDPENPVDHLYGTTSDAEHPKIASRRDQFLSIFHSKSRQAVFWSCFFLFTVALAIASDTTYLYLSFATSYFGQNPLLSTIGLLTAIMSAVIQPFWAKIADKGSRSLVLAGSLVAFVVGYAVSAGCQSVHALAAGQTLYSIGSVGLSFAQTLIIADLTSLQFRGIAYGIVSIIYLPFAFIAPNIASGIGLENWRWGYGMFCIILPVCLGPLLSLYLAFETRIRKEHRKKADSPPQHAEVGFVTPSIPAHTGAPSLPGDDHPTGRRSDSVPQKLRRFVTGFASIDPLGLILMATSFSLLLAPPTLYAGAKGGWSNPSMIAMEVVGGVVFVILCIWESVFAPHPAFPKRMWYNRNFATSTATTIIFFLVTNIYNTYWSSWLWVVTELNEGQWTYVSETGTASLCVFTLVAGLLMRFTHRFKLLQLFGIAVATAGAGLNYYSATHSHARVLSAVWSQILIQGGAAFGVLTAQAALQGSVSAADLAIAIATYIFSQSVGGAVGAAVAGSQWSPRLMANLQQNIPTLNATDILGIAGDITIARISEPRQEIIAAFDETYQFLARIALIVIVFAFIPSICTLDYKLDQRQNVKDEPSSEQG